MKIALICFAAAFLCGAQDIKDTGPTSLVIVYKCIPEKRIALREYMRTGGLAHFQHRKETGMLSEYHVLFSRYVDTTNWDMMAVLSFPDYAAVQKWKRVERDEPAGLDRSAVAYLLSASTYPVDAMRRAGAEMNPPEPVFFAIPYTITVPPVEYLKYFDEYVRPQFDGWIEEGVLLRYSLFTQRYTAARPWDSLIVLEYKDDASFGEREKVVAKVRAKLKDNPVWKARSDNKQSLRIEKDAVIADELR